MSLSHFKTFHNVHAPSSINSNVRTWKNNKANKNVYENKTAKGLSRELNPGPPASSDRIDQGNNPKQESCD